MEVWEKVEQSALGIHNGYGRNSGSTEGYAKTTCGREVPNNRTMGGSGKGMSCPDCIREFNSPVGCTPYMLELVTKDAWKPGKP